MFDQLASSEKIDKTKQALEANGFSVVIAENSANATAEILSLIPQGSQVMTMTSITLQTLGLDKEFNESGRYESVRTKLNTNTTPPQEKRMLGAAPQYTIGSVHAITERGEVIIVSNTGSQLAAYVYGAEHVVWVVGAQKIVTDAEEGMRRIKEYVAPLESERARKAYNLPEFNTYWSKILTVGREVKKGRISIVLVKESLGF